MKMKQCYWLNLLITLSFLVLPDQGIGQEPKRKNESEKKAEQHTREAEFQAALYLAQQVANDVRALEPLDERVRLLASVGDVLWQADESRSRRSFSQAFDLIIDLYKPEGARDAATTDIKVDTLLSFVTNLAVWRDKALVQQFEDKLKAVQEDAKETAKRQPRDISLMFLTAARALIDSDEAGSAGLFRQSVYYNLLREHIAFLAQLSEKKPLLADHLFSDAINVLAQRPLSEANEAMLPASYLFSKNKSVTYSLVGGYNAANASGGLSEYPRNEQLAISYLNFVLRRLNVSETIPPAVVHFSLKSLMPQFQSLVPDLVAEAHQKMNSLLSDIPREHIEGPGRFFNDGRETALDQKISWEDRISRAEKMVNADLRDLEYFTAINGHYLSNEDFDNATRIAERIDKADLKEKVFDYICFLATEKIIGKGETSDINEAVRKIKDPMLKTVLLCDAARTMKDKKNSPLVLELLGWARTESERIKDHQDKIQAKLLIAQVLLVVDEMQAMDAVRDDVKEMNRMDAFNIRRSSFEFVITVHILTNRLVVNNHAFSFFQMLDRLSRIDYIWTHDLCKSIENKSNRLWAMLAVARRPLDEAERESKKN